MARAYPEYPSASWDYAVIESARQRLIKPNKRICLYCHAQALSEAKIVHEVDCPNGEHLQRKLENCRRLAQRAADETYEDFSIHLDEGNYSFIPFDESDTAEHTFVEKISPKEA
jgi:hypothetical protein